MYTLALLVPLVLHQPPAADTANQLLREMDAKITAAKTLRIEFEITSGERNGPIRITGSAVLGDGNRFRHDVVVNVYSTAERTLLVSDGKRIGGTRPEGDTTPFPPLPAWHNRVLHSWLGRGGTFVTLSEVFSLAGQPGAAEPAPADGPQVSDATLLPDEEVGGVKARVVEYVLTWMPLRMLELLSRRPGVARVRVWIDPTTNLPLRRRMIGGADGSGMAYTCTHTRFEIDPKLDDKLFVIP